AAALDEEDRLTRDVLAARLDEERARGALDLHRWALDPLAGPHVALLELIEEDHPRRDAVDGEALLARLRAAPAHLAAHAAQLAGGLHAGLVAPRLLAARVAAQLDEIAGREAARVLGAAVGDLERAVGRRALASSLRAAIPAVLDGYAALRALV